MTAAKWGITMVKRLSAGIIIVAVILLTGLRGDAKGGEEQRWQYFSTNVDGYECFYDTKSLLYPSNNIIKVWTMMLAPESDGYMKQMKYLYEIDCTKRLCRTIYFEWHYKDGHSRIFDKPSEWSEIMRKTVDETLFNIVCTNKSRR